jgi:tRNA threonylcarbamoyladenosine biosynthesis protein TsaE
MNAAAWFLSNGPEETRTLGERLGTLLQPGDVVLLSGELGAGKTTFVQGIARGLRFEGSVSSKSFVIMGEYRGSGPTLYHADLYRLEDPGQVWELGLDEISRDGVLVVEWPERAPEVLPEDHLLVEFAVVNETARRLELRPQGGRAEEIAQSMPSEART